MGNYELKELKEKRGLVTRDQFYKEHRCCPDCNNTKLSHTMVGVVEHEDYDFYDKFNTAKCKCGWRGPVGDLLPEE